MGWAALNYHANAAPCSGSTVPSQKLRKADKIRTDVKVTVQLAT